MLVFALRPASPLTKTTLARVFAAGSAWGLTLSVGMTAIAFQNCGVVCLDDVAVTTATSVALGILTIGPLAIFRRQH